MTTQSISSGNNPFSDQAAVIETERDVILDSTLAVGRNASLTLGADNLIVLDEGLQEQPRSLCCGLIPQRSTATRTIPYFNVLSAELTKVDLTIKYAKPVSSKKNSPLFVSYVSYSVSSSEDLAQRWTTRLLNRAYGTVARHKRIKVLINPFGGSGKASKRYYANIAPIFEAAGCQVDVERTTHQGHAVEIAEQLDINAFDVLACASGDGLPMECFNGLAKKPNAAEALRKIAVVQLPCGTGNAMSWNFNGTDDCSTAALCIVKGLRTPLDLASITQGTERTLSFLSQSLGIVAESDLGTDNIRWMGDFRFTYGFLVRLLGKTMYPVDIAVKTEIEDKTDIKKHYAKERAKQDRLGEGSYDILDAELETQTGLGLPPLRYGTIQDPLPNDASEGWSKLESYPNLGNFYCGNMCWMAADAPFFPASLPSDGMLDLVTIDGDIGRMKAVKLLLAVADGTFFDQDVVRVRKISGVRVIPKFGNVKSATEDGTARRKRSFLQRTFGGGHEGSSKKGYFSVDGESLPFEPYQIEIHRGLGTSLSRDPGVYQYEGPKGWRNIAVDGALSNSGSSS